jgi:hypothetical protein
MDIMMLELEWEKWSGLYIGMIYPIHSYYYPIKVSMSGLHVFIMS